jgi:hypothetical protein
LAVLADGFFAATFAVFFAGFLAADFTALLADFFAGALDLFARSLNFAFLRVAIRSLS